MTEGCKLEDLEDALDICTGQVNAKNEIATDDIITEQAKVLGQHMSVTNFVHKNWYVFCSKVKLYKR
jgi:hypothetical protein